MERDVIYHERTGTEITSTVILHRYVVAEFPLDAANESADKLLLYN